MLPKIINMFAVCPLCANPAQGKSFWRTDLMVCCCLFNYIVCNPAVVSRWTQVVISQLTSRPSESKLKPVGFFVIFCDSALLPLQGMAYHLHTALVSPGTAGSQTSPEVTYLEQKVSVRAETSVTLIPEQRGPCFCLVPPRVPNPWPVPTPVKEQSKGTLWSVLKGNSLSWICPFLQSLLRWLRVSFPWGKTVRCDTGHLFSMDCMRHQGCSVFLMHCKH